MTDEPATPGWTSLLYDVASILASTEDPERRVLRALARAKQALSCDRIALWEKAPILGQPITTLPPASRGESDALARRLADLAKLLSEDPPHRDAGNLPATDRLAVPLVALGDVIGMFHLERSDRALDEQDLSTASGLAALLGSYLALVRSDRELRESQRRLRTVYEAGLIAIAFLDASGTVRDGNERALGMLATTRPALEESPEASGSTACVREALRVSEARFARIISIAADAIISTDDEQRVVLFNQGAERMFGYSAEEMLGQPLDVLLPERFRGAHRQHVRRFASGIRQGRLMGAQGREVFGLRRNGEEFPAECSISSLESGGGASYTTAVLRDISERRRVELEQRFLAEVGTVLASSLDYEETLTSIAELSVQHLADACIIDLIGDSGTVRRLKVAVADPARAQLARRLEQVPVGGAEAYIGRDAVETKQAVLMTELTPDYLRSLAHDASHLAVLEELAPTSLLSLPLLARDGCLGVLVLVSTGERRRYGAADLRMGEELARRAALAIDNAHLYRTARHAVRARGEVLGVVAHDLRGPISVIQLAMGVLKDLIGEEQSASAQHAFDTIERASKRAQRLIQDLLDVHRLEAGELPLARATIAAAAMVGEALDSQRRLADNGSIELAAEIVPGTLTVFVDRDRLLSVLENLLGNAIKFTPAGGRIVVRAQARGTDVLFRVSDDGQGISAEDLPRVFDRFWRADRGDRRGAGLGLAICKGIVELHGGRIWADSTVGQGTTVSFTVPEVRGTQ